jgi:alpha-glucoside transport system substrate-binding protein
MPAFSLPAFPADAWVLTDWFENLYLRMAGPDRYDALAAHRIPWTDPTVTETLRTMAALLDEEVTPRPRASFPDSVGDVFSTRPRAAMVMEGDFVPGVAGDRRRGSRRHRRRRLPLPRAARHRSSRGRGWRRRGAHAGHPRRAGPAAATSRPAKPRRCGRASAGSSHRTRRWTSASIPTLRRDASLVRCSRRVTTCASTSPTSSPWPSARRQGRGLWAELSAFVTDPTDVEGTTARIEAVADASWEGR